MTPRSLLLLGTTLLLAAAAAALAVAALALWTGPIGAGAFLALATAWPLLSLLAWHKGQPGTGWGLMVPFGLQGLLLGFGWGGFLLYGLVPYAAGNLAFRWLARTKPNP